MYISAWVTGKQPVKARYCLTSASIVETGTAFLTVCAQECHEVALLEPNLVVPVLQPRRNIDFNWIFLYDWLWE